MRNNSFYNSIAYKERQAEITRENWQDGIYDFLRKRGKRQCANPDCGKWFEAQLADPKKFCSRKCAAQINNPKRSNIPPDIREKLIKLYQKGLSMQEISDKTGWNYGKVIWLMRKFNIPRRNWSDATYVKRNPNGDPFKIKRLKNKKEFELFNLGIGLYLGEGDKRSKYAVKVANSDPKILKIFLRFLQEICGIRESKIGAELNIFDDVDLNTALEYWARNLGLKRSQFKTLTVRKSRGGTYKNKSKYGTLSIYVTNNKLKNLVNKWCEQVTNEQR